MYRATLAAIIVASLLVACSKTVVVQPRTESASSAGSDGNSTAVTLGIPPGHLPKPGQCRIWFPGQPPGKQGLPGDCARVSQHVPLGAWLVHRPSESKEKVEVSVYDERRPNVVVVVRYFHAGSGMLLREKNPGSDR